MRSSGRAVIHQMRDGHSIFLFKKGGLGTIVGIYNSIKDIVDIEKRFNPNFTSHTVSQCLSGRTKHFFSFNHQCKCAVRILPATYKKEAV